MAGEAAVSALLSQIFSRSFRKLAKRHRKDERGRAVSGKHGRDHENYSLRLYASTSTSSAARLEFFMTYTDFLFGTT